VLSTHCHDDLGLAVANSLAGVRAGARQVECAINGIGERAGNASLEEIMMLLHTRAADLGFTTGVQTREIARTSRMVSRLTGYPVQPNKAVVGRNAFAHESGIHQHGVLQDRLTYEIMRAEDIGLTGAQIVLGKHSGRHAFARQLTELGYELSDEERARAFARFKELADRKAELTDKDLEAIVADEVSASADDVFELESLQVSGGTATAPTATVRVRRTVDDVVIDESAMGDGMVDAACGAIRRAAGIDAALVTFNVAAVTGGIDALGDVTVQVEVDGRRISGRGVSTDIVEASARAFLSAINKSVRLRHRVQAASDTP
jgi:2-isopropylmalate synthase